MVAAAVLEIVLWWIAWRMGVARPPIFRVYSVFGWTALGICLAGLFLSQILQMMRQREERPLLRSGDWLRDNYPRLLVAVFAMQISSTGAAAFSALKTALPAMAPFWLDHDLVAIERQLVGMHPWQLSHQLFGWATHEIDLIYSSWIFVQVFTFCVILTLQPSRFKTTALVSYALAWPILGVGGAYLLSSAGPIFYDRLFELPTFAALDRALKDAPVTVRAAEWLWKSYLHQENAIASGISAMPSLHVAIALWIALLIRHSKAAVIGWAYFALICLGSVHLGWHYASDALVATVGFYLIWRASAAYADSGWHEVARSLSRLGLPKNPGSLPVRGRVTVAQRNSGGTDAITSS